MVRLCSSGLIFNNCIRFHRSYPATVEDWLLKQQDRETDTVSNQFLSDINVTQVKKTMPQSAWRQQEALARYHYFSVEESIHISQFVC